MDMSKKPLLSVIVPVYNTESYLRKCLESILSQTYRNLDIILVDDGSTDLSGAICDEYAKKDSRILVLHQENQGVVCARNQGITAAKGDFLAFVDSDDWIELSMYEKLMEDAWKYDLITSGMAVNYCEEDDFATRNDLIAEGIYVEDGMKYVWENMIVFNGKTGGLMVNLVNKIFRTELAIRTIENILTGLKYNEDAMFTYSYAVQCRTVRVTHSSYYHYRMNPASAVHNTCPDYLHELQEFYWYMLKVFQNHSSAEALVLQLQRWINFLMIYCADKYLGFRKEAYIPAYIYPFNNQFKNKKIILYGAGIVGQNYHTQILKNQYADIQYWIDRNYKSYSGSDEVKPIDMIARCDFEYLIIAVKEECAAEAIRLQLIAMGVPEGKIVWKRPQMLADLILN